MNEILERFLAKTGTVGQAAQMLGVDRRSIQRWQAGATIPAKQLKRIKALLDESAPAKGAGLVGRAIAKVVDRALGDGESMLVPLVVDGRIEHHGGLHAAYLVESGRGQEPLGGWSRSQAVALYLALKERRHMVYEALNAAGALVGPNVAESLQVERDKFTRGRELRRGLRFLFGGNQR